MLLHLSGTIRDIRERLLTRSVKDLCELLERFERRGVALVSVAESLDTGSAAGRLVLNIMTAVSQWIREQRSGVTLLTTSPAACTALRQQRGQTPIPD